MFIITIFLSVESLHFYHNWRIFFYSHCTSPTFCIIFFSLLALQSVYSLCTAVNSLYSYFLLHLHYILHIPTVPAVHTLNIFLLYLVLRNLFLHNYSIALGSNPWGQSLSLKKNGRHKPRSGQHTLARQKYIQKNPLHGLYLTFFQIISRKSFIIL